MTLPLATDGYLGGDGGGGDTTSPTITASSPTPETDPGDVLGFPSNRSNAEDTPIVLVIDDIDPGLEYICVTVRAYQDGETNGQREDVINRNGEFKEPYRLFSSQSLSGTELTLELLRDDGWGGVFLAVTVDAVDGDGNLASEEFIYELPPEVVDADDEPAPVEAGALDHTAAALDRICWQFRAEAHGEII